MKTGNKLTYALLAAALLAAGAASAQTLQAVRFKTPGPLLDPKSVV